MNEEKSSLFPLNDNHKRIAILFVGVVFFALTLLTYPHGHNSFFLVSLFSIFYYVVSFFVEDFKESASYLRTRYGAVAQLLVYASMKILTVTAIVVNILTEGTNIGWFWVIVVLVFLNSAQSNISVAICIRKIYAETDRQIELEAAVKQEQEICEARERSELIKEKKAKEDSLLESLAFLADIDPKNK